MNRHLINYAALPSEVLGTPIRPDPAKPRDGEWKPLRPGYESRTLAGGAVEVRCTSLPVRPEKPAAQKYSNFKDREQAAFEEWIDRVRPSGDHESVQYQWMKSAERAEFIDGENDALSQEAA